MKPIRIALPVLPAALLAAPQSAVQERTAPESKKQDVSQDPTDERRTKVREMLESAGGQASALPADLPPLARCNWR